MPEILTESGVNPEGKPFVAMRWGGEEGQFSPAEARLFGLTMIEAAESAEHDAAFLAWGRESLKMDFKEAARMMGAQRQYRARLAGGTDD